MHTSSEEHNAEAEAGEANIYFATDNLLIQMPEFKFKLIFNGGVKSGGSWTDAEKGTNMYPTLSSWLARWPLGSQIDVDNVYGCQCVDYMNAFWWAQVNRAIIATGGIASGIWTARVENAGTEFDLVTNWDNLQPGDWAVWEGTPGHVAMVSRVVADTKYFYQQNYNSPNAELGGPLVEAANSSQGFLGGFRYRSWQTN